MSLVNIVSKAKSVFLDTAPIIYYIEAHEGFGPMVKSVVDLVLGGKLVAFSSVVTLLEVLPKPVAEGNVVLAGKFADFLKHGRNMNVVEISEGIAERAGRLRGTNPFLKGLDALQIAAAIDVHADLFLTNDLNLRGIKDVRVLVLKDYVASSTS